MKNLCNHLQNLSFWNEGFLQRKISQILFVPLLLISFLALAGCSILTPVSIPQINTYQLTELNPDTINAKPTQLTLLVSTITSAPGYEGNGMAYVNSPYQLSYFTQNTWVSSPANMLQPLLKQSLQNTGRFKAVVTPPYSGFSDVRLDVSIVSFYQDTIQKPNVERVTLNVQLVNLNTHRMIVSKQMTANVPTKQDTPYGGVAAANQAVSQLLAQIAEFTIQNTAHVQTVQLMKPPLTSIPASTTITQQK